MSLMHRMHRILRNDYSTTEDIIAEVEVEAKEDLATGDIVIMGDKEKIENGVDQEEEDNEVLVEVEAEIIAAYLDAAKALLTAELIDEANLRSVAYVISDTWVVDVE